PGDNAAEVSRAQLRVGLAILAEHPLGALRSWARGELRLLDGPGRAEIEILLTGRETIDRPGLRAVVVAAQIVTFTIVIAALIGLVGLVTRWIRLPDLWIVAASAVYLVVIAGGPEAYSRFRVPVAPFFVTLGAAALFQAIRSRKAR